MPWAVPPQQISEPNLRSARGVDKQFSWYRLVAAAQVIDGVGQIGRVPVDDGGDYQVQTRGAELLRVGTTVGDAPLLERA